MKKDLGEAIKAGRLALGLSGRQLARLAGISHSYLALIEANKISKPSPAVLKKLAEALPSLDYGELLLMAGHITHREELPETPERLTYRQLDQLVSMSSSITSGVRMVPLVAKVPAGFAQSGEVLVRVDDEPHFIPVAVEMVGEGKPLIALRVVGNSMVGEGILPGDLVVVEVGGKLRNGEIWVFRLAGGEHTLKLVRLSQAHIELVSRSPGGEVARFSRESEELPVPIGRVIMVVRSYCKTPRRSSRSGLSEWQRSPQRRADP